MPEHINALYIGFEPKIHSKQNYEPSLAIIITLTHCISHKKNYTKSSSTLIYYFVQYSPAWHSRESLNHCCTLETRFRQLCCPPLSKTTNGPAPRPRQQVPPYRRMSLVGELQESGILLQWLLHQCLEKNHNTQRSCISYKLSHVVQLPTERHAMMISWPWACEIPLEQLSHTECPCPVLVHPAAGKSCSEFLLHSHRRIYK